MSIDISVIWFVIIVFATLMYIVMDGFDLGIGMLFSVVHDGEGARCDGQQRRPRLGW